MDKRYKDIQSRYREEMHAILPGVMDWWFGGIESSEKSSADMTDFEDRWPAGPAAHPRVLHVFRRYFLETIALNMANESGPNDNKVDPTEERNWGTDATRDELNYVLPIDLLVHDLEHMDIDLFEVLGALVFVPVGINPSGEFV